MSQANKPKVSVIIATHNRASLVTEAINSALNQSFKDFEIIVVDDGSTDNTRQVLEKYKSSLYYMYQDNRGRSQVRNTGIKTAKGEYIAFLDDDDIWLPLKLEKQVAFLDSHPEIGLVHTFTEVVDEVGHLLVKETRKRLKFYKRAIPIGYTYEGMSRLCIMFLSAVMVRSKYLDEVGLFDPDIPALEDWDFHLRFSLKYRIGSIPEPLVAYRMHKAQSTMEEFTQGRIRVAMKHLALLELAPQQNLWCGGKRKRLQYNFYLHLANAYYIDTQLINFRIYALKALKLNPWALFCSRLGIHLLMTLLPYKFIQCLRR